MNGCGFHSQISGNKIELGDFCYFGETTGGVDSAEDVFYAEEGEG